MAKTSATPLAAASAMNGTTIRLIQVAVVMFVVAVMMFVRRPDRLARQHYTEFSGEAVPITPRRRRAGRGKRQRALSAASTNNLRHRAKPANHGLISAPALFSPPRLRKSSF
jgi:hypothetical protein